MTLQGYINKHVGKGINFDNAYGFQCMDLAEQYNRDVIGAPRIGGNAIDAWEKYSKNFYERIINTPTGVPQAGDIIIWGKQAGGGLGHIEVVVIADVMSFTGFSQNWPSQGYWYNGVFIGTGVPHFQQHTYKNPDILGWLHPKK